MNAQIELIEGTNRNVSLSQYFTPPDLAAKVVEWACEYRGGYRKANGEPMRVLEPSAGNGALVRPLVAAGAHVEAVELDVRYMSDIAKALGHGKREHRMHVPCNFLELPAYTLHSGTHFDLCVMNPPYEDGKDVAFILHALEFAPRVVGIFQAGIEYGVDRYDDLWSVVRPTRILKLKRRWFKSQDGKGGLTNYVVLELMRRSPLTAERAGIPDRPTLEWW